MDDDAHNWLVTANGSARSNSDYVGKSGVITSSVGQTCKTFSVTVNGDTAVEANETRYVLLLGPVNAQFGKIRGTGTLTNDDVAG